MHAYVKNYQHVVFAVHKRQRLIDPLWEDRMYAYMGGILQNERCHPIEMNGDRDHVHLFFDLHPTVSMSDFMEKVKSNVSKWINDEKLCAQKFAWQRGYFSVSVSPSDIDRVIYYIKGQKQHHQKNTFEKEYRLMLERLGFLYNRDGSVMASNESE